MEFRPSAAQCAGGCRGKERKKMKFSDMTYTRPDLEAAKADISAYTGELKAAGCYEIGRAHV